MNSKEDSEIELQIERLTNEGDGVANAPGGPVVFVPFTAPGDRVRARVVQKKKRFWRAECLEVLEAGPGRKEPRCSVFGRCGGCAWQHLTYEAQLEAKAEILKSALERIGKLTLPGPVEVLPSPRDYGYRGRARFRVKGGKPGYLRRASHEFCATTSCPVLLPILEEHWKAMCDERKDIDGEWELAAGKEALGAQEIFRVLPLESVSSTEVFETTPEAIAEPLFLEVLGDRVELSPGGFAQANPLLYDTLAQRVAEAVGRGDRLLELYCGAGFFTVGLARQFSAVRAMEQSPQAGKDLGRNLVRAGVDNVLFTPGKVEELLREPSLRQFSPEVVFLDPPRVGMANGAVDTLCALRPRRIVYLSCDPATLSRDLARMHEQGYRLQSVQGIDLFPQTPHVEALAVMEIAD